MQDATSMAASVFSNQVCGHVSGAFHDSEKWFRPHLWSQLNDDNFATGAHDSVIASGVIRACWKPSYCCWA
jgi:hypothetical protein